MVRPAKGLGSPCLAFLLFALLSGRLSSILPLAQLGKDNQYMISGGMLTSTSQV